MGENHFRPLPVALYAVVLLMSAVAYTLLVRVLVKYHGHDPPLAFVNEWISMGLYVAVAALWFVPDRRIEKVLKD